jgi:acetolactate synthase regulatory subunit
MGTLTFEMEIHDQPDVLVRIMETMHRQGGHVRSLQVDPGTPWATTRVTVQELANYGLVSQKLEKLIDVRRVRILSQNKVTVPSEEK